VRRLLFVLLVLTAGTTPAQASPRPLAYVGTDSVMALAGDRAYATTSKGDVISVPTAGGRVSEGLAPGARQISASPARAALVRDTGASERRHYQVFAGPPFAPLEPPLVVDSPQDVPLRVQVDGDRLYTFRTVAPRTTTVTVREPDPHEIAFPPSANPAVAVFKGDLVAYPTTWTDRDPRFKDRRLIVTNWRTGEQRYTVDLPSAVRALDLRPSGRVLATVEDTLFDISPTGAARLVVSGWAGSFAGEHIVLVRGSSLRVLDPSGQVRRFGVRTHTFISYATDETRVLWAANGCLLVASVTDAPADTIGAGPCPRGELKIESGGAYARELPVRLRCVTGRCRGELRLRFAGQWLGPWQRFSVPARRARRILVRLTGAGARALERAGGFVTVDAEWRIGALRVPLYGLGVDPE
jgi:hypothetical protein